MELCAWMTCFLLLVGHPAHGLLSQRWVTGVANWKHHSRQQKTIAFSVPFRRIPLDSSLCCLNNDNDGESSPENNNNNDTIRVRIWRALVANLGQEMSLKQLGVLVGERRPSDLKFHLQHVAKQAKTLDNKSDAWRERRGIRGVKTKKKLELSMRRDKKRNLVLVKLG